MKEGKYVVRGQCPQKGLICWTTWNFKRFENLLLTRKGDGITRKEMEE